MKIFDVLNHGHAIKTETGYIVGLDSGLYLINGVETNVPYNGSQVWLDSLDRVQNVVVKDHELKHWLTKDGNTVSKQQRQEATEERSKYWDEDSEEYVYPDIETEFDVRKRTDNLVTGLTPVYEEPEKLVTNVEFEVIGVWEDTGSEYIETPYQYGRSNFSRDCVYKVHTGKIARDALSKWYDRNKDSVGDLKGLDHPSNIRFAKIAGKYVTSALDKYDWCGKTGAVRFYKTLDEAKDGEDFVRNTVMTHLDKMCNPKHFDSTIMYEDLLKIQSQVAKLDVKQKASADKRVALQIIQSLLDKI